MLNAYEIDNKPNLADRLIMPTGPTDLAFRSYCWTTKRKFYPSPRPNDIHFHRSFPKLYKGPNLNCTAPDAR